MNHQNNYKIFLGGHELDKDSLHKLQPNYALTISKIYLLQTNYSLTIPRFYLDDGRNKNKIIEFLRRCRKTNIVKCDQIWQDEALKRSSYVSVFDEMFKTATKLACGLGQTSVHETFLILHHTWGVPYLPGSSFKGLLRHVVYYDLQKKFKNLVYDGEITQLTQEHLKSQDVTLYYLLFGAQSFKGLLVFPDIFPCGNSENEMLLDIDFMTPLSRVSNKINKQQGLESSNIINELLPNKANPIFFFVVPQNVIFHFQIWLDNRRFNFIKENPSPFILLENISVEDIKDFLQRYIVEALEKWGFGSKTRTNYGKFKNMQT